MAMDLMKTTMQQVRDATAQRDLAVDVLRRLSKFSDRSPAGNNVALVIVSADHAGTDSVTLGEIRAAIGNPVGTGGK